jgi:hypothetical protein
MDATGPITHDDLVSINWDGEELTGDLFQFDYHKDGGHTDLNGDNIEVVIYDASTIAEGTLSIAVQPEAGETIEVGESGATTEFTWAAPYCTASKEVNIGDDATGALNNIADALGVGIAGRNILHLAVQPALAETITIGLGADEEEVFTWKAAATGPLDIALGANVSGSRDNWMTAVGTGSALVGNPVLVGDGVYMTTYNIASWQVATDMTGAGNEWEETGFYSTTAPYEYLWVDGIVFPSMDLHAAWGGARGNLCLTDRKSVV